MKCSFLYYIYRKESDFMNHEKVAILVDSGSDVPAELLER